MNSIQNFLRSVLPAPWAASMEAESRAWMVRCTCAFERSVWDLGGIRWKAAGNPRRYMTCPHCGQATWHTLYKKEV